MVGHAYSIQQPLRQKVLKEQENVSQICQQCSAELTSYFELRYGTKWYRDSWLWLIVGATIGVGTEVIAYPILVPFNRSCALVPVTIHTYEIIGLVHKK